MDSAKVFEQALKNTTFSQNALEALAVKIAESPKKDGIITMRTTTDIDGVPFGEPMKITAAIRDGKIHRDNGPAVVIDDIAMSTDGSVKDAKTVLYMRNGVPDRADGPAVTTAAGDVLWMQKGQLHRENGPAALVSGKPVFALEGKAMTPEEFESGNSLISGFAREGEVIYG